MLLSYFFSLKNKSRTFTSYLKIKNYCSCFLFYLFYWSIL
ncbi:hypothetical protein HMPREF0105_1583 [Bacteroides sp. 3_1_33FAA]|uniref:Uncharacterized protein n=1 Tax=Phocaeicola dorei DSM 17855 TaxID=483217 RepID=B6VU15_9BACT|nr:hypothetical protein BACDOR_00567 [Phocaeicola dorei DSM 17855]EEZ22387.1 hypothetical protein HMPREF0105_1583 [Bacteroides sp. 3_1_33FAA]